MKTLGLDIGGANIKAAHSDGGAWSEPFALWKNPALLPEKLTALAARTPPFDRIALTTTAELCDCFPTKRAGVQQVLDAAEALASGHAGRSSLSETARARAVAVWFTSGRFAAPAEARENPLLCAGANWHALASALAPLFPQGLSLLIDTGSTTTDIIKLRDGQVHAAGLTDIARLATGELVYIGARRTPLMALGHAIAWRGRTHRLMAELFATTADVHLLLGNLPEDPADTDTADGRPFLPHFAAARIVRMIGADLEQIPLAEAHTLAEQFSLRVIDHLTAAIRQVLAFDHQAGSSIIDVGATDKRSLRSLSVSSGHQGSKKGSDPIFIPDRVILSGSGDFIGSSATAAALPAVERIPLAGILGPAASSAACAWAVMKLMHA